MGQYSAKETILKLRECIFPRPRKDEMVNKLSHDTTVPLIHISLFQHFNRCEANLSISRKGCLAEIRTGTYRTSWQAGAV
jgi:hypothetical protein